MDIKEPMIWAVVAWAIKEIYQTYKDKGGAMTVALKANTDAICDLKLSVMRLEERLSQATELAAAVPKVQRDLDVAHAHIRIVAPHLYHR